MKQKGNSPIIVIALIILIISGMLVIAQSIRNDQKSSLLISTPEASSQPITTPLSSETSPTTKPTSNGVSIDKIKYTLPNTWKADLRDDGVLLLSANGGGYLGVKVLDYDGKTGRREAYCDIVKYCIDSTYFTPIELGNISGYKADSLDNSGGGADYFGTKGNKFYLVSSYGLSMFTEYINNYQKVLDSLVF